jgi:hypothetical protein
MSIVIFTVMPRRPHRQPLSACQLEVSNPTMRYNIWADRMTGLEPSDPDALPDEDYGSLTVHFQVAPGNERLIHTLDGYRWDFQMTHSSLISVAVSNGDQMTFLAVNQSPEILRCGGIRNRQLVVCQGPIQRITR